MKKKNVFLKNKTFLIFGFFAILIFIITVIFAMIILCAIIIGGYVGMVFLVISLIKKARGFSGRKRAGFIALIALVILLCIAFLAFMVWLEYLTGSFLVYFITETNLGLSRI